MTKIKANQADIEDILNDPLAGATETKKGTVEIATQDEVTTGTDTLRVITPDTLSNAIINQGSTLYEPLDATILRTTDLAQDVSTILFTSDITVTVEAFVTKNTGFNLNLGTDAGTVSEGNHTHALDDLSDVVIGGSPLLSGHTLTYDGVNWINQTPDSGVIDHLLLSNIGNNTHVQIDAHILDTTVHFSTLDGLSDVVLGSPVTNQVLTFDGSNWVNADNTSVFTLDANDTLFAGTGAGASLTTGPDNFLAGAGAGTLIAGGGHNVAIGNDALAAVTTTNDTIGIGRNTLKLCTGNNNVAIGGFAGYRMTTSSINNVLIGLQAGAGLVGTGNSDNIAIGTSALGNLGSSNTTTIRNIAIGSRSLDTLNGGDRNVAIGYNALTALTTGTDNTSVGDSSGVGITSGTGNVFLGTGTGWTNVSNELYIHNAASATPLIHGDFFATVVTINGTLIATGGVDALTSATTVIDVSSAAAPTTGQVLTATTSTTAVWQTPSGGGSPVITVLDDLADVVIGGSPLLTGHTLTYDGANWINQTPASGITDHTLLSNIGTNTHVQIDAHIVDSAIHFTTLDGLSDVVVAGSPAVTNQVLTFNGTNWVNSTPGVVYNWISGNNGADFDIAPSATIKAVAAGRNATASGLRSTAFGYNAQATNTDSIAMGTNARATTNGSVSIGVDSDATGSSAVAVGDQSQSLDTNSIAMGYKASATKIHSIAIGQRTVDSTTGTGRNVLIGAYASTFGTGDRNVAIGQSAKTVSGSSNGTVVGEASQTDQTFQTVIGSKITSADVTTDVPYSLKIGVGDATNLNIIHLHTKGHLELYGDEAQIVFPNYIVTGSPFDVPASADEGAVIYDSVAKGLQLYGGSPAGWSAIGAGGGSVALNDLTDVTLGSPVTNEVLTFDGSNWVNSTPGVVNNWITANNGVDFTTPPSAPQAGEFDIAIGDSAVANGSTIGGAIAIGSQAVGFLGGAQATAGFSTAVGSGSAASGQSSIAIGASALASGSSSFAVAGDAIGTFSVAMPGRSTANNADDITIGQYASTGTGGARSIAIGRNATTSNGVDNAVVIGSVNTAALDKQVIIGNDITGADVTSDVAYSVKFGTGTADANKNMLHLYSKGKLELYGDEAQYIFPSYAVTGSPIDVPANSVEGGVIYDSTAKGLQLYDGASWSAIGGGGAGGATELNDLTDVVVAGSPLTDQILKHNGTNWVNVDDTSTIAVDWTVASQIGNSLPIAAVGIPSLASLDSTTVAFRDASNDKLETYTWDGVSWTKIGNSFFIVGGNSALAALDSTTIAYIDGVGDQLRTYSWDGTDWAQVGNSLAIAGATSPALAALNSTDVAFIDASLDKLETYRWNGTDWVQVGNSLTITVGLTALAALGSTTVALIDDTNDQLRTYSFDGTDWAQIGNSLTITGASSPALAALNSNDVAFIDSINETLETYRWDGTDWAQIGSSLIMGTIGTPALAALDSATVAFIDSTGDALETYSFASTIGDATLSSALDSNYVSRAGDTTSGQIKGITPISNEDLTRKDYVDGKTIIIYSAAVKVGNSLTIAGTGTPALAALDSATVAFFDATNDDLETYSWSGTDWTQVGNSLTITNANVPALATMDSTTVAFVDGFNDQLRTYSWDGTDWSLVGTGLTISGLNTPALTALTSTVVAFIDAINEKLETYTWNGSAWSKTGNSLTLTGTGATGLAALNSTTIALVDGDRDKLETYTWSGTDWTQVGNSLTITGIGTPALAALTTTTVAFIDSTNDKLETYRWDGVDWTKADDSLTIAGTGIPALAAMDSTTVAFYDATNDKLETYDIDFIIGSTELSDALDDKYIDGGSTTNKPTYEAIVVAGSPVSAVVTTTVSTVALTGNPLLAGLLVFRNGAQQSEGVMAGSPLQPSEDFAVTGANELTFGTGVLEVGNKINIYVFE